MNIDADDNQQAVPSPSSSSSYDAYQAKLQLAALTATKRAFVLPQDIQFHRTLDKNFGTELDAVSARVFAFADKLLRYSTKGASTKGKGRAILKSEEDLLDGYHLSVVDTIDHLYETADQILDQITGRNKPAQPAVTLAPTAKQKRGALDPSLLHATNLAKPQLKFKRAVDNSSPWNPRVKKRRLDADYLDISTTRMELEEDDPRNNHPYLYETIHLQYPDRLFEYADPIEPRSYEETPFTWIDSVDQLPLLLEKLSKSPEIAVDLEYHSLRSYYGFVCLMQISTREEDFVIDTLALRDELEVLNDVFTNPSIIKVFHGADSDIVWLQQDFNLHIVNLFDTYQASLLLGGFPKFGLASLLTYFCNFEADKRYQLADWRIRPLPEEMLFYARSDTHFLLFIYDNLRNLLLQRADAAESVERVLNASSRTALQVHNREMYDVEEGAGFGGWRIFLSKFGNYGANTAAEADRRRAVVVAVHSWRDRVARELDESPPYVLQSNMIFRLANAPNPPQDLPSLFRMVSFNINIRDRAQELLDVILTATLPASLAATSISGPRTAQVEVRPSLAEHDSTMLPELQPGLLLPDLWKILPSGSSSSSATTSSLFGSIDSTESSGTIVAPTSSHLLSQSSSLFGESLTPQSHSPAPLLTAVSGSSYQEVIQRIHKTLVLAPTISSLTTTDPSTTLLAASPTLQKAESVPDPDPDVLMMPAEVAFVPAAERTSLASGSVPASTGASTTKDPLTGDTIVVVGRKREKKKARKVTALADTSEAPSSGRAASIPTSGPGPKTKISQSDDMAMDGVNEDDEEVVPFEFSSVPNILDNDDRAPSVLAGQKRSKKQKASDKVKRAKGSTTSPYGDFPAPPRNRAEPRSGNVSHTFK